MLTFYFNNDRSKRYAVDRSTGEILVNEISSVSGADEIRRRGFIGADTPCRVDPEAWAEILASAHEIDPMP